MITDPAVHRADPQARPGTVAKTQYGRFKGKATRGLVIGTLFPQVLYRPLSVYERSPERRWGMDQLITDRLRDNLQRV